MPDFVNDGPGLEAWRGAWHPREAAARLSGVGVPWHVVGGWAIDLFLGAQSREHEDLEIAVARVNFPVIRAHLAELTFYVVGDGEIRALADDALPPPEKHQNWVCDPRVNEWRVDVMLEPDSDDDWRFRRDESVRAPRRRMVGERDGIPFLEPAGALLFKAKYCREKDQADFDACLPRLDEWQRTWLREALMRVHPDHAWIRWLT